MSKLSSKISLITNIPSRELTRLLQQKCLTYSQPTTHTAPNTPKILKQPHLSKKRVVKKEKEMAVSGDLRVSATMASIPFKHHHLGNSLLPSKVSFSFPFSGKKKKKLFKFLRLLLNGFLFCLQFLQLQLGIFESCLKLCE